jgi:hypothetical protein
MDLDQQSARYERAGSRPRPRETGETTVLAISEHAGLVMRMAIPAAGRSSTVSIKVAATWRRPKKDVNFNGTNRTSPLESIKVSKNKPKNGAKET